MKFEMKFQQPSGKIISLHDCHIKRIQCQDNSVIFNIENGLTLVDGDSVESIPEGSIEVLQCKKDDFFCYICFREPSKKGEKIAAQLISLKKSIKC